MSDKAFTCEYGYFDRDGREYVITRPDTPRPWINVISNGNYGFVVGQSGTGFSWLTNANLNRITRFTQDMVQDDMGKFLYIRDDDTMAFWSAGWKPVCSAPDSYKCKHGIGYTRITSVYAGIQCELTMFVPPEEPLELWKVRIENQSDANRNLSLYSYLEWNLGVYNIENREFQKIFINTEYDASLHTVWAAKRLWEIPNQKGENLNADWEYVAFHSASSAPTSFDCDRESFVGMYGSRSNPRAMRQASLEGRSGSWTDPIASLQQKLSLAPGEKTEVVFLLGVTRDRREAQKYIQKYRQLEEADRAFQRVADFWEEHLSAAKIDTPDPAMNILTNVWLKYQAISCRLWSRTAYYQSGGAYGFRDQLQDSQLFLPYQSERTKEQILLHACHQHGDGTVKHWWHPISEEGPDSRFSDDLLWLPLVVNNYLVETADFSLLDVTVPFLNGENASLYEHCKRAIDRALRRFSLRGIPLIGEADWNDGLSACGTDWIGESFWVGEFLCYILERFLPAADYERDGRFQTLCLETAACLKRNINLYGWDGCWYAQCTTDSGKILGSKTNAEGSIFLNPQTWAILSGIIPPERVDRVVQAVRDHLIRDYGALLLYPAYTKVDSCIGYLTRYAPGLRENGGVYSHAAVWAIQAFCTLGMGDEAYSLYRKICPILRSGDIERYMCEPYVMPGNTDGPDSPHYGRGGWTWYTGSAAWLFRVTQEHILGIRPSLAGLHIDPCIPKSWSGFRADRVFRGATYHITVSNPEGICRGVRALYLNGEPLQGNLLPVCPAGSANEVSAVMG